MSNLMLDVCNKSAARLTAASIAAAAWTLHLAVYPAALATAYSMRGSWPSFEESLEIGSACFEHYTPAERAA